MATDGSAKDNQIAGASFAIFDGHDTVRDGKSLYECPVIMDFKRRVFGTPSSNRAELFAVLAALRACRNVKELHLYCDIE